MEIVALRWFQQVADGTTVTQVSQLESVTQSGVSRALARLEAEIGTPLLTRNGRVLRMTQAGATFKRHVDRLLHDLDDGLSAVSELMSPDSGTVSIAFQLSLGTWLLPQLIAGFHRVHPDVQFDLHQIRDELTTPRPLGTADLDITTVRSLDEAVEWRPLLVEPLRLAVPRDHRLADRHSIKLEEIAGERFVMLRSTYALRRTVDDLCRQARFIPKVAFEGDDLMTVEGLVGAGLGVAIVPSLLHERGTRPSDNVRNIEITDPDVSRTIGLAWSTDRALMPAAQRFRDHVLRQAGALTAGR